MPLSDKNVLDGLTLSNQYAAYADVEALRTKTLQSDLSADAAAAQADVVVRNPGAFFVGQGVRIVDSSYSERANIKTIDGNTITMVSVLVNTYTTARGAYLIGVDTNGIQEAVNSIPAWGGTVYLGGGQYVMQAGVIIEAAYIAIVGQGSTTQIDGLGLTDDFFRIDGVSHTRFQNLIIASGGQVSGGGINAVGGGTYNTIDNCIISGADFDIQGVVTQDEVTGGATFTVAASDSVKAEGADFQCDGVDDQVEIQAAIDALPATGGLITLLDGTFTVSSKVSIIKSNVHVKGLGRATIIKASAALNDHVLEFGDGGTTAVLNVGISDLKIDGTKATVTTGHGIHMNMLCAYFNIRDIDIENVKNDALHMTSSDLAHSCAHNIIQGVRIFACDGYGIYAQAESNDNLVVNNEFLTCGLAGIYLNNSQAWKISGNLWLNCVAEGIKTENAQKSHVIVANSFQYGTIGISLGTNSTNMVITGNSFFRTTAEGVKTLNAGGCNISNNEFHENHTAAIHTSGARGMIINGNIVSDQFNHGIWLEGSHYCTVSGNVVREASVTTNNTDYGIWLYNGSDNNVIIGNTIECTGANRPPWGIREDAATNEKDNYYAGNKITGMRVAPVSLCGQGIGPLKVETIQPFLAYGTDSILAANFNGTFSATAQPDVARNLVLKKTGATAVGGQVIVTGKDQFGNVVTETTVFAGGAATTVGTKVFASIDVTGIVISALTAGDTIEVGVGNKLGLDHKIVAASVKRCCKSGVGNYTGITSDVTYHAVTMADNIVSADIYQITSWNVLS